MNFIKGLLIVIGIATVASAIIGLIKDCRGTNETYDSEIYYNPCVFEVGQEIETVAYQRSTSKNVTLKIEGCELMVVLRIIGIPPQRKVGDVLKFRVVKVNSELSYDVEVVKPEKATGATPTKP